MDDKDTAWRKLDGHGIPVSILGPKSIDRWTGLGHPLDGWTHLVASLVIDGANDWKRDG